MRCKYEQWPENFFIEIRAGSTSPWVSYSRDPDLDTMNLRFDYQVKMLKPGGGVRMLNDKGTVLKEKTI